MALQFGPPILQRGGGTLTWRPIGPPQPQPTLPWPTPTLPTAPIRLPQPTLPPGLPTPPVPPGLALGAGLAGIKTLVGIYPSNYDAVKKAIDDVLVQLRSRCYQVAQNCNVQLDVLDVSDLQGATTNIYTRGWRITTAPAQSVDVLKFTVPNNMAIGIGGFAIYVRPYPLFDIYKINIYGDLQGSNKLYTAVTYASAYIEGHIIADGVGIAYVPTAPIVLTPGSNLYINVELDPELPLLKSASPGGENMPITTLLMPIPLVKLIPASKPTAQPTATPTSTATPRPIYQPLT